jgi:hypothetical protein
MQGSPGSGHAAVLALLLCGSGATTTSAQTSFSATFVNETGHPLSAIAVFDARAGADDVFGTTEGGPIRNGARTTLRLSLTRCMRVLVVVTNDKDQEKRQTADLCRSNRVTIGPGGFRAP